jgi:hypothetical protein
VLVVLEVLIAQAQMEQMVLIQYLTQSLLLVEVVEHILLMWAVMVAQAVEVVEVQVLEMLAAQATLPLQAHHKEIMVVKD